jgi:glycerol-3-phosphate acyltransferase PlsX
MDEKNPAEAVRARKASSIAVACRLVKEGAADAFFSAGNTGACMAAATLAFGRIDGVERPAIAVVLPSAPSAPGAAGATVLLDVGANAECRPSHLAGFGVLGSVYAEAVLGIARPRVGLLSIGEEPGKGTDLVREAHDLLKAAPIDFRGNAEGRDIVNGRFDVVVTDGFTGNVVLKFGEGVARLVSDLLKAEVKRSPFAWIGAPFVAPALLAFRRRVDHAERGGALLLGLRHPCVIGHGSSSPKAVANAIRVAREAVVGGLVEKIGRRYAGAG